MYSNMRFREQAVECVTVPGLWLEFGVYHGLSARHILNAAPRGTTLYGFDTFRGLPEGWRPGYEVGHFNMGGNPPDVAGLVPVVGMIQDTLRPFLHQHPEPCALVHVDTDIYSSAKYTLETLRVANRLVQGTIVIFDELAGHDGWQGHEWQAAQEELFPFWHCVPVAARVNENGCVRAAYRLYDVI